MRAFRVTRREGHLREVERFVRSKDDRLFVRWSTTAYRDGERYTSWALTFGRWKRTLRYCKSRNG